MKRETVCYKEPSGKFGKEFHVKRKFRQFWITNAAEDSSQKYKKQRSTITDPIRNSKELYLEIEIARFQKYLAAHEVIYGKFSDPKRTVTEVKTKDLADYYANIFKFLELKKH